MQIFLKRKPFLKNPPPPFRLPGGAHWGTWGGNQAPVSTKSSLLPDTAEHWGRDQDPEARARSEAEARSRTPKSKAVDLETEKCLEMSRNVWEL